MADEVKKDAAVKKESVTLKDLSVNNLKAMAYDEGVKIEIARNNLQVLNQEIANRQKQVAPKPATVEPAKKEEKK